MKPSKQIALGSLTGLILLGSFSDIFAQQRDSAPQQRTATTLESSPPAYKPPLRGAPGGRVGGGTRGGGDVFALSVLAPDHTGLTMKEQPCLFWFISTQTTLPVELTIVDRTTTNPILETRIASPVERGIHRLRLADYGVRLAPGVPYQWSVAVVPDAARRSRDILASGTIERVEPAAKQEAGKENDVSWYAETGIWYDALEALSDWIDRSPGDTTLRRYRAALLAQAGLLEIAE